MSDLIKIKNQNGNLVVGSREVATNFGKEHRVVLKAIDDLIADIGSAQNYANLFIPSEYLQEQNKQTYREYLLTRDGFSLLVMGFTGKKALEWKLKYIDAFNKMEATIKNQQKQIASLTKRQEIDARLKNARSREANILLKIAKDKDIPREYRQILYSHASQIIAGKPLLPLPETEETYSAEDIAKEIGITANMLGRVANRHNLKTPEYGLLVWDKSPHCDKQVQTWRYNKNGRKALLNIFRKEAN